MALERYQHLPSVGETEVENTVLGNLLVAHSLADVTAYGRKVRIVGLGAKILAVREWFSGEPVTEDCFVLVPHVCHDISLDKVNGNIMITDTSGEFSVESNWYPWFKKLRFVESSLSRDLREQPWNDRDGLLFVTYAKNPAGKDSFRLVAVSEYPSGEDLEQRIINLRNFLQSRPILKIL